MQQLLTVGFWRGVYMFNQQIKVPVSIVCELTDIKESRLQKAYTMNYFPDSFRLRDPDDDLSCYSANAVHIDKEEIERLKPVEISSSLIRSVSKYQIVI